eukprot:TRINITY_DN22854_c0_g2_i1.p1 TRINITY_DN22854_c0_g2~~TRINITY_DN22854_c0_g2_i1.p1  ORF type:complete len:337 (+),score=48.41 TRINITY_DN22854_c0_g2_i1:177-1187(+)
MSKCPFHNASPVGGRSQPEASGGPPIESNSSGGYGNLAPATQPSTIGPSQAPRLVEEDLECPVCLRLLFEPVSLQCGHSFCRPCLQTVNLETQRDWAPLRCPMCRTDVVGDLGDLRVNALLAALVEKFLPEAAARRRLEVVEDNAADRERHYIKREVNLKVSRTDEGTSTVSVQMAGVSRCPMHQGARVPIFFYFARAEAKFPTGWTPETGQANGQQDPWLLQSTHRRARGGENLPPVRSEEAARMGISTLIGALDARGIEHKHCLEKAELVSLLVESAAGLARGPGCGSDNDDVVNVTLHFQPRFQTAPMQATLKLQDGASVQLSAEFDGRLVHR